MEKPTSPQQLNVAVNDTDKVTALLYPAKGNRTGVTLLLAHGAGGNQMSAFMRLMAGGLSQRGVDVMTFNFVYSEKGRRVPDQPAKLEACWRAAIEAAASNSKLK